MRELLYKETWTDLYFRLSEWIINELPSLILLTIGIFLLLRLVSYLSKRIKKLMLNKISSEDPVKEEEAEKRALTLLGILKGIIKVVLWSIFILIMLDKFGLNLSPILTGAGILGLAVGFGAQELVRDIISGFFILLENQMRKNDVVIINGTIGEVQSIELRTTTLRDVAGVVHVFQNGKINTISNMTKEWAFAILDISVSYQENVDRVISIMDETFLDLKHNPQYTNKILNTIEIFGIDKFTGSSLIIKARIKTTPGDQWSIGRAYRKILKENFDKHGVQISASQVKIVTKGSTHEIIEKPKK